MTAALALSGLRRVDPFLVLMGIGFLLLYATLLPELARDWAGSADFSHGFAVPVVTAWLLWSRREALRRVRARPYLPGALLLALAVLQYLVGVAASEFYLQRSSMVTFLGGWILLVWGPGRARLCLFPVAFLLFAIPPPRLVLTWIAFPLQLLASRFTEVLLHALGTPALRAGNVIHLEGLSLEVAQACSGLRSLVTLLALGSVIAEGSLLPSRGGPTHGALRGLIVAATIPVAVGVNSLRIAGTAVLASQWGAVVTTGWMHELAGVLMFVLSLTVLLAWRSTLAWVESRRLASRPVS